MITTKTPDRWPIRMLKRIKCDRKVTLYTNQLDLNTKRVQNVWTEHCFNFTSIIDCAWDLCKFMNAMCVQRATDIIMIFVWYYFVFAGFVSRILFITFGSFFSVCSWFVFIIAFILIFPSIDEMTTNILLKYVNKLLNQVEIVRLSSNQKKNVISNSNNSNNKCV